MGLTSAVEKLQSLYDREKTASVNNDVAVKAWGYNSLSGPALQTISTLTQFGLIEKTGTKKIKISELGLDILLPKTPGDKTRAIQTAASQPTIFRELINEYPKDLPSDETLKATLVRRSVPYIEEAATKIIKSFKETRELLNLPEMELVENIGEKLPSGKELPPPKPPLIMPKEDFVLSLALLNGKNATLTISGGMPNQTDIGFIKKFLAIYEEKLPTGESKEESKE